MPGLDPIRLLRIYFYAIPDIIAIIKYRQKMGENFAKEEILLKQFFTTYLADFLNKIVKINFDDVPATKHGIKKLYLAHALSRRDMQNKLYLVRKMHNTILEVIKSGRYNFTKLMSIKLCDIWSIEACEHTVTEYTKNLLSMNCLSSINPLPHRSR